VSATERTVAITIAHRLLLHLHEKKLIRASRAQHRAPWWDILLKSITRGGDSDWNCLRHSLADEISRVVVPDSDVEHYLSLADRWKPQVEEVIERLHIIAVVHGQPGYPPRMASLPVRTGSGNRRKMPPVLYIRGSPDVLQERRSVAIVGTRKPSEHGRQHAFELSKYLAGFGYTIVSGLALGIDTEAHCGALVADGKTVAVLATPLEQIYPKENSQLAEDIVCKGGALVSEWPIGHKTQHWHFLLRNRIQSALSSAVVVVETRVKGGAQETAAAAIAQGRKVFVPHPVIFGRSDWISDEQNPQSGLKDLYDQHGQAGKVLTYQTQEELLKRLEDESQVEQLPREHLEDESQGKQLRLMVDGSKLVEERHNGTQAREP
jgi:DNA protecting protein DprA